MAATDDEEEDVFEWDVRKGSIPFWQHAVAGSCAGVMEHICMYPVDTIKTRIQASSVNISASETFIAAWREGGLRSLMRGSLACSLGCIPAHIGLFGTYEFTKALLMNMEGEEYEPLRAAATGAVSNVAHDVIMTPTDVVKQRLQMGGYRGMLDCVGSIWRQEGLYAFYRSLPTTLVMGIPHMSIFVATNDSLKRFLGIRASQAEQRFSVAPGYFFAGGCSGAVASTITMPLDVVKTKLQTQGGFTLGQEPAVVSSAAVQLRYSGIASTVSIILQEDGWRGFFRGLGPRVALAMPAGAICWGTYETMQMVLNRCAVADAHRGSGKVETQEVPCEASLEWEEWDQSTPFWKHAVAGSCAGMMEHVAMYPIDTVKTRMQAAPVVPGCKAPGLTATVREVLREQGAGGLMRGCLAIGVGCIPAHIGLFCTYEITKARLVEPGGTTHQPLRTAACGALATVVHDMIITPTDVVKQRLQLGRYDGMWDCVSKMLRHEGVAAFYRSLPTTLISECPFHGVLVASNESLKILLGLSRHTTSSEGRRSALGWHFLSTGISGMVAAVVTQPLDVVKTRLQTQHVGTEIDEAKVRVYYKGLRSTVSAILRDEGPAGLFRGTVPRLLFAAPSAAMCWGTYEVTKALLW